MGNGFEDSDFGDVEWLQPQPAEPAGGRALWTGVAIVAAPAAFVLLQLLRSFA